MEDRKKLIAYKVWISDILMSEIYNDENPEFPVQFIKIKNQNISKVNVMANVVEKFLNENKSFASITLDDGSGSIRAKAWKEDISKLENINIGDIVNIIGRPRVYNEESYIVPELIRKVEDPNFEVLRKLELLKLYGKPNLNGIRISNVEIKEEKKNEDYVEEIVVNQSSENNRQTIIKLIEKFDDGNGTEVGKIIDISNISRESVISIINELLTEGEIFEIREGYVKLLG